MTPEHLHLLFPISLLSAACHVSQVPGDSAVPGFDSSSKSQHQIITAGFYIKKPTMRQSVHSILWKTKKRSGIMISFLSWVQFKKKESKKEKNVPLVAYKSWYIWQTGCNCTTQSRLTCTTKRQRRLYDCLSFVLALHVKISEGKWVKKKITANKRSPPMRTVRKVHKHSFHGLTSAQKPFQMFASEAFGPFTTRPFTENLFMARVLWILQDCQQIWGVNKGLAVKPTLSRMLSKKWL